ncbi:MAG: cytochrome P450 [Chloroflexota bacterium]|nr:cytochrome P450 [Chloroflexota bacterium]
MTAQTDATTIAERVRDLVDRINRLAAERVALYRKASEGWTPEQRARLKAIDAELAELWQERRRAQAGHDDPNAVPVRHAA